MRVSADETFLQVDVSHVARLVVLNLLKQTDGQRSERKDLNTRKVEKER